MDYKDRGTASKSELELHRRLTSRSESIGVADKSHNLFVHDVFAYRREAKYRGYVVKVAFWIWREIVS